MTFLAVARVRLESSGEVPNSYGRDLLCFQTCASSRHLLCPLDVDSSLREGADSFTATFVENCTVHFRSRGVEFRCSEESRDYEYGDFSAVLTIGRLGREMEMVAKRDWTERNLCWP
jgi:hypothetical protein